MNIYKPIIGELSEEKDIHSSIEQYKSNGTLIENKLITKLEDIDLNAEDVEFEKCIFKDCKIQGTFERAVFHREGSFIRVAFKNSKLVGCDFSESRIYHMSADESIFKYANFSNTSLEEIIFNECDLANTSFSECKIKHIYFEKSKLIQTQFFKTKLKGIDISTCEVHGLITSMEDIKGIIVNSFQAIELSKLMEIVIK